MQQLAAKLTPEQRRQAATGTLPKKTAGTPTPTPAVAPAPVAAAAPAEAPTPGSEATPASPDASAPVTTEADSQPGVNPAGDGDAGEKGTPNRFRFTDPKDQAVAVYAKAHGISLIEAAQRLAPAAAAPAASATPAAPAEAEPDHEVAAVDKRISETQKRIEKLTADRKKAMDDLDNEKTAELNDSIAEAKADAKILEYEKNGLLKNREEQAVQTAQQQINTSRDRAFTEFPQFANGESMERRALNHFINEARENPARRALFNDPSWPEILVREFATKYDIKPKAAAGTAPVANPAAVTTPAPGALRKPAPVQAAVTPAGARLLTSAGGQAPAAPKPMTMEEAKAKLRADPKLGAAVFKHLGQKRS